MGTFASARESVVDKSLLVNLIALTLIGVGLILNDPHRTYVLNTGLFALSGALTNWLAIHMLFEKVPGFYGSGVIPSRFEEFKKAIRKLIMEQFFSNESLERFFQDTTNLVDSLDKQLNSSVDDLDLNQAFESLVDMILASSFGSMLGMIGGRDALNSLKPPFIERMRKFLKELLASEAFRQRLRQALGKAVTNSGLRTQLEHMIDHRLDQMTPVMVKEIVQAMIRKHLGWLVVWGCVFGGAIGLLVTVVELM